MPDSYPIFHVSLEPKLDVDPLGDKPKFWFRSPTYNSLWMFKYNTRIPRDYWSEKIAAEVAELMGISHPRTELAVDGNLKGVISESFVHATSDITSIEFPLTHGNQILQAIIPGYDTKLRFRQRHHTLANILLALERNISGMCESEEAKRKFAGYLLLDAIIGNVDRHHTNWGLQRSRTNNQGFVHFLAPSFDHASSLGRDLNDEVRVNRIRERRVRAYVKRGRGKIYWAEDEHPPPSPLALAMRALSVFPSLFEVEVQRLENLDEDSLHEIVERVPDDWMSLAERKFAIEMMCYSLCQLRKAIQ
ncbi:MAG: hypothetical protein F4X57_11020 [Chloroflexi bacterium]|nr:hypothetical protein [Chloroflexota bacterium]